ncbi:hypothetical protein HZA33_02425 [Candidatus Pacearchaeota archaeon]|nr:hypothetical protein [Candidatus Pacearchaeota archaeon]
MEIYGGLEKEKVFQIYNFVLEKRKELGIGQRKLSRMVKERFNSEIKERTIAGWIFLGVIPFANEKTQFKAKPKPKKEEIYELYIKQNQSAEKLGKRYGVSTIIVINWLKSYNISTRSHIESMNTPVIKEELKEKKLRRPTKDFLPLSPEKAYILGVLCGDGCLVKRMVRLEIRNDEEFIKKFVNSFKEVYGLNYTYFYYPPKKTFVAQISSDIISKDLASYGKFKTKDWNIPIEIMESNDPEILGKFLRGFYDSEGCSASRCAITCSSINKGGLEQIAILLQKLGIKSTLRPQQNNRYYVLFIFRKGRFKIFIDKIGFTIKRKMDNINKTLNTGFFTKRSVAE